MQSTFEKLQQLQGILSKKFVIENEIDELPKAIVTRSEVLNRMKKGYIEENESYEISKEKIKHLRYTMSEAESNRESLETKMEQISTQREYEALGKEIESATEKEQQIRKDIQKEEESLENLKITLEKKTQMIEAQEEELKKETERIESNIQDKKSAIESLEQEEKEITPGMNENIIYKFERIIKNKSGVGIVPVKNGVCSGCNMILPAQFVNDVRTHKDILFCPYCSRILFYEDTMESIDEAVTGISEENVGGLSDIVDDDFDFED